MTAYLYGEHYSIENMLWSLSVVCAGCQKKCHMLKLEMKITSEHIAIVCPYCAEPAKTARANKHRNIDDTEQELRKAVVSLVNELRFKMLAEREQRAGKNVTATSEEGCN